MKILITGKNSYIGNSFYEWVKQNEPLFEVKHISLRNTNLNAISFKGYDVIFHVAGIAHMNSNKILIHDYFRVNRDLAIDVAKKAKQEGVNQFIFTSSMAVYGEDFPIGQIRPIDINYPKPANAYGQSKLEADLEIQSLNNEHFKTVILRIPMIYGKNAKGNFPKLYRFSKRFFIYPEIRNQRSVLHINNLSRLVTYLIKNNSNLVLFPQDGQYLETIKLIKLIRAKKITITFNWLNLIIKVISKKITFINKIFGNKFYIQNQSKIKEYNYQVENIYDFTQFINS